MILGVCQRYPPHPILGSVLISMTKLLFLLATLCVINNVTLSKIGHSNKYQAGIARLFAPEYVLVANACHVIRAELAGSNEIGHGLNIQTTNKHLIRRQFSSTKNEPAGRGVKVFQTRVTQPKQSVTGVASSSPSLKCGVCRGSRADVLGIVGESSVFAIPNYLHFNNGALRILCSDELFGCCSGQDGGGPCLDGRLVSLILGLHSEFVSIRSFLLQLLNLRLGSRSLIFCSNSQIVSVNSSLMHLPPLSTDEDRRDSRHDDSGFSPSQSGFFKAAHLFFDFCELLCGGWCLWRGVYLMGFLDLRGWFGIGLIILGFLLFVHGGYHLLAVSADNVSHELNVSSDGPYRLVPITAKIGASTAPPGPLRIPELAAFTRSSYFQSPASMPADLSTAIRRCAASRSVSVADGLVPIRIPRAAAPPVTCHTRMVQPLLFSDWMIDCEMLATSSVPPKVQTSKWIPFGNSFAKRASCDCASGVRTRSARLASNWILANRSFSAVSFASAAALLAVAMSSRNFSAFAFASAACCSAEARLAWAFPARSFASPAALFDSPACFRASAILTSFACESMPTMRSFSAINASCVSANERLFLLATNCAINTPTASRTVRATRIIYALFQCPTETLKSWARAVNRWISDTFSPLSLACSLIMLFAAGTLCVATYKLYNKNP